MVVCEVALHRIEELLVRFACELCPTFAIGGPALSFIDRSHVPTSMRSNFVSLRPAEAVSGWP